MLQNNNQRGGSSYYSRTQPEDHQYDDDDNQAEYEEETTTTDPSQSSDRTIKKSNKINIWGNSTTMNITQYLYKKILSSPYFKSLYEYKTYHEVLELIKNIKYIHPFTDADTSAEPSIAFSLLFKLHTLKLSKKQLKGMFSKESSTITRAMALLYVRFAVQPDEMWDYFKDFVNDENSTVNIYTKRMSLGEFVRSLITNQKIFGSHCILPILPVNLVRRMEDSDEFSQSYQKNKRKYSNEKDYSDNRRYSSSSSSSYYQQGASTTTDNSRKKQKSEFNNSATTANSQSKSGNTTSTNRVLPTEEDFEPAESRFSKPTFSKSVNNSQSSASTYSKKYGTISKEYTTTNSFSKKDITEVETLRLSK